MKLYTNESQTAKLIELGFEKPKMAAPALKWVDGEPTFEPQYTIGELIEMLLPIIDEYSSTVVSGGGTWSVHYKRIFASRYDTFAKEFIDALYNMIIKLKEEGVI